MTPPLTAALKDLLFRLADDDLILGHRNSEWTGLGPILEEDIAFASMAQDQLGHAQAYYLLLGELGEASPDLLAFTRPAERMRCCHLVEMPISGTGPQGEADYAFCLVRHWLYESAKQLRLSHLAQQTVFAPLAELARKILREHRYHSLHAHTWITQLATRGTDESRLRIQSAVNETLPMALGLFEATDADATLTKVGVLPSEAALQAVWSERIAAGADAARLSLPSSPDASPYLGGRRGYHSDHLAHMLAEMTEVFAIDPAASW